MGGNGGGDVRGDEFSISMQCERRAYGPDAHGAAGGEVLIGFGEGLVGDTGEAGSGMMVDGVNGARHTALP